MTLTDMQLGYPFWHGALGVQHIPNEEQGNNEDTTTTEKSH